MKWLPPLLVFITQEPSINIKEEEKKSKAPIKTRNNNHNNTKKKRKQQSINKQNTALVDSKERVL